MELQSLLFSVLFIISLYALMPFPRVPFEAFLERASQRRSKAIGRSAGGNHFWQGRGSGSIKVTLRLYLLQVTINDLS